MLSHAQELKFALLAEGLQISPAAQAYIDDANGGRKLTPADYASTSGVILALEDDVWVNAPIHLYNPNFVAEAAPFVLGHDADGLFVEGRGHASRAKFWLPPLYHGENNASGKPYTMFAFTHADRVRVSPIQGCSHTCQFCNLPYDFPARRKPDDPNQDDVYQAKAIADLVDSVARARKDTVQPAHHVLVSGGVPFARDEQRLRDSYVALLEAFPDLDIDIMMVPANDLLDVGELARLGVNELSINIELFDESVARRLMPLKFKQGRDFYLRFIAEAATHFDRAGRVRSMLVAGLEPMESTLDGVRAIAERGGSPVLSPFRPDRSTPLRDRAPPDAIFLRELYLRARDITDSLGVHLGPQCIPCSHNTLTLADGTAAYFSHGQTNLV